MKKIASFILLGSMVFSLASCDSCNKKEQPKEEPVAVIEEKVVVVPVVTEDQIYNVPVKPAPVQQEATPGKSAPAPAVVKPTKTHLDQQLSTVNIIPTKTVDTTFFCFTSKKLNTKKTVVSYEKEGEERLQIVSDPTHPDVIDYIVFSNKKDNVDVYNVHAGMTTKEVRELRHDMKHFVKKGKAFLYKDDSNILYELDGITSEGKEITDADIDNMSVSAIIWKDKDSDKK